VDSNKTFSLTQKVANAAPGKAPDVVSVVKTMPRLEKPYSKKEWVTLVKSLKLKPKKYKTIKQGTS
jgi:hypothetical protein